MKTEAHLDALAAKILDTLGGVAAENADKGVITVLPEKRQVLMQLATGLPFIHVGSFHSAGRPGTRAEVSSYVFSPPSAAFSHVFATIAFGLPAFGTDFSALWAARHPAWPYLSTEPFRIDANAPPLRVTHTYNVPAVPAGVYNGSVLLWREAHDVPQGQYFSRSFFYFKVLE